MMRLLLQHKLYLFLFILLILASCTNQIQQVTNPIESKSYIVAIGVNSNDEFFYLHFTHDTFYGQTICNHFSGSYSLEGDKVIVSNFQSSNIEETNYLAYDLLHLLSDDFYFTIHNNELTLKRDQILIDFLQTNTSTLRYEFYDYTESTLFIVDTTKLYLKFLLSTITMSEVSTLFAERQLTIDTEHSTLYQAQGTIQLNELLTKSAYLELIQWLNNRQEIVYASLCRKKDDLSIPLTNQITLNTSLTIDQLSDILNVLSIYNFTIQRGANNQLIITLNDMKNGYESLHLANQLASVEGVNQTQIGY